MIKVFITKVNSEMDKKEIERLLTYVPQNTKERFYKFRFLKSGLCTLAGELMVRDFISKEFSIENKNIHFETNKYGKPFVKNNPVFFNISHSNDWVVCAVSDSIIGIDIQEIEKEKISLDIAKRFFCKEEYEMLLLNEKKARELLFFHLWTLKESYVKWLGMGLSKPLNAFCFKFIDDKVLLFEEDKIIDVNFKKYEISKCFLTVCSKNTDFPSRLSNIKMEDIILGCYEGIS